MTSNGPSETSACLTDAADPKQDTKLVLGQTALLAASTPGKAGVGSAYLDALIDFVPDQSVFHIGPGDWQAASSRHKISELWPDERYTRPFGSVAGTLASVVHHWKGRTYNAKKVANEIEKTIADQGITQIWTVLESPFVFRVSSLLAQNNIPMIATVWDPPAGIARQFGLDTISRKKATTDFYQALAGCQRVGVISEEMGRDFETRFPGLRTSVMRYVPTVPSRKSARSTDDEFVIAFAGSIYASIEFQALLSALDAAHWTIDGRKVRVKILGAKFRFQTSQPACIEFLGYRSSDEVINVMSEADCGYVPYWFASEYETSVRLCFPSKLISCLVAESPIFFHGPENSTPSTFLKQYAAGVGCHTTSTAGIVDALEQLAGSDRLSMQAECRRAVAEEFNQSNFEQRFHWLITGMDTPK